jgi:hypothetical protein
MARTITSANAVYMLGVSGVFSTPQQLQGFAVDDAFETEAAEIGVVEVGVDGVGVGGYTPRSVKQTIALQASSVSVDLMDQWIAAMDSSGEVIYANGIITLKAIQAKFILSQGLLTRTPTMPAAKKVLQMLRYEITWMPLGANVPAIVRAPLL